MRIECSNREALTLSLALILTLTSGANAFAAWENKIYVTLCGGIGEALTIVTVDQIVLSIDIEVSVEEFFDSQYLVRTMASLYTIYYVLAMCLPWPYHTTYYAY